MALEHLRSITLLGAPSNIGIRPYDDGRPRELDRAPRMFRDLGLARRIGAKDLGDVVPQPYRDFVRPPFGVRNEREVGTYQHQLADRVADAIQGGAFPVVLGGDCSIVLGCTLAARRAGKRRIGLAYVDAHADFASPRESRSGSAASMCLAMTVGRGDTPLARLDPSGPLVRGEDVVIVGRRDNAAQIYGEPYLREFGVLDLNAAYFLEAGPTRVADAVLDRVAREGLDGFWLHLDADVLDASVMSAVDSPEPNGPDAGEVARLLNRLVREPKALGLDVTIYDPGLDLDLAAARILAGIIEQALTAHP
jgi:arginase